MTTFKNNAKYGEVLFQYLDFAMREDSPLSVPAVLKTFSWTFSGGSLAEAAASTRLQPETGTEEYPHGTTISIAEGWPNSRDAKALKQILKNRVRRMPRRARDATLGTWLLLTARYRVESGPITVLTGMSAIYRTFGAIWEWSLTASGSLEWEDLMKYTREMALGAAASSMMHVPDMETVRSRYWAKLESSRVPGLLQAVEDLKLIMREVNSSRARGFSRRMGRTERERLELKSWRMDIKEIGLEDYSERILCSMMSLGGMSVKVTQKLVVVTTGRTRWALGQSDVERLHQLTMSATSCLIGCVAQAAIGTPRQSKKAMMALDVAERNIGRIVRSSSLVALGKEVLVCKGYRRAYTAHLGYLAGPLCLEETKVLIQEARETAPPGVLDVDGYLEDLRTLDAAGSLNAGKVFKICPAPDVSPGAAMIDRIKQIGDCNIFDKSIREAFTAELRAQILRAHIRGSHARLRLRPNVEAPLWHDAYLAGRFGEVPSDEIHTYLAWEGTAVMPDVSPYDASMWKDSGLGADSIEEANRHQHLGVKKNMITRLLFDDDCPMPGSKRLSDDHVIKFFIKAEGHKDPARGIFSSNLLDRQAQSWMEKAVEKVARNHPSFMIGASSDQRDAKVQELTLRPTNFDIVPMYYSFDISGWSAKMPKEPQRISHQIWAELYGGHLFTKATQINEGAYIYLALDGYRGWYRNTESNLEGFNGKEMTMILVTLLSLSVKVWRKRVVEAEILTEEVASTTVALLFAYIDDGLSRIDLPRDRAVAAFTLYKECVIETFARCGYTVETSKCFPSDQFAIFLNEVYLAGRHVVHGVRAAMGISAEPTERHNTLIERLTSVSTGCRGAVMAGLNSASAVMLMAYHSFLHIREWVSDRDPILWALWSYTPRSWGGLGMPNMFQLSVSGSGAAAEEGTATMQRWARISDSAKQLFLTLCRTELAQRSATSVLTAPLSCRVDQGYMIDSRVASMVREALRDRMERGQVSRYAERLLKYADPVGFQAFAEAVIPMGTNVALQEQMLDNVYEAHPHSIFSSFAKRVEKSVTVSSILGRTTFEKLLVENRLEAKESLRVLRSRINRPIRASRRRA